MVVRDLLSTRQSVNVHSSNMEVETRPPWHDFSGVSNDDWQRDSTPSSRLPLPLRRINLFGPWGPHSFPLAVRAPITLLRSAFLGMTTTWVSGMLGWSMIRIPSGKHWVLEEDTMSLLRSPSGSSRGTSCSFLWKGSFLLLRIKGLLGLCLILIISLWLDLCADWISKRKEKKEVNAGEGILKKIWFAWQISFNSLSKHWDYSVLYYVITWTYS